MTAPMVRRLRKARRRSVFCCAALGFSASVSAAPLPNADEASIHSGEGGIPLVLSAAHGGTRSIPDGKKSTSGIALRDMHTEEIALELVRLLEDEFGAKPFYAVARFSRDYVDANRGPGLRPHEAYSGVNSKRAYEAYHEALRAHVEAVRNEFGAGLLVDIHGQSSYPDRIIRGTVDGRTVEKLWERHGSAALNGPDSIFGQLHAMGYTVEPPLVGARDSPADETLFEGGYIVRAYGSHNDDGIDAVQIEIGYDYRESKVRDQTTRDLADAIAAQLRSFYDLRIDFLDRAEMYPQKIPSL